MSQDQNQSSPPPPAAAAAATTQPDPPPPFDPSRMIGIIKRKALIKELAAVYHAECLAYCQELLELQKKWNEPLIDDKSPDDSRKKVKPPKRLKKSR